MNKYPQFINSDIEIREVAAIKDLGGGRSILSIARRRRDYERGLIEKPGGALSMDDVNRARGSIEALNWLLGLSEKMQQLLNNLPNDQARGM